MRFCHRNPAHLDLHRGQATIEQFRGQWAVRASPIIHGPLTLSSTACVAFKLCATAIRASSCVNLSNFFSASFISVLPISVFPYFSKRHIGYCSILLLNYSLNRLRVISFVAIPRIERTSAIMWVITSVISVVSGTSVYTSIRRKNISMLLKTSTRVSWPARTSFAA